MKPIHMMAAFAAGFGNTLGPHKSITDRNRIHDDRAKAGSVEETERLCAAQLKRERKNAKRASEAAKAGEPK